MAGKSSELRIFNATKLQELYSYKDKYKQTLREWKQFVGGDDDIDLSIVPADVLDAWKRCRRYGLDPLKLPKKTVLRGAALEELMNRNREFIEVSRPFLKNLYRFLEGSGFRVCLFDREGYLLEVLGGHDIAPLLLKADGVIGALWSERSAGHNVSGTIVELKKPIQIFGSQHYIKAYHGETGSGAPVFSPDGDFLGGVTLTGRNFRANPHTMGMAVAAAHAIENELRGRKALEEVRTAYMYQDAVISSIMEAMITIDKGGAISLINDAALRILAPASSKIKGEPLAKVLGGKNAPFLKLIDNNERLTDREVRIFRRNSWNDYTLTMNLIAGPDGGSIGKVIVLNEIRRAKTMAAKMLGAGAVFRFEDICGADPRFLLTLEQARVAARSNSNILLLGKSGTGKDIFAQAIHNASERQSGPYIAINCGAIPRDLIASELFGHEEGAFTGARRGGHQGKFELAEGGTIFLDEIAETPLELQTALLRVIEDKVVTRIGGKQNRKVDVRIIAAANKDLREEIRKGNFREDLFYRINVFTIEMVPLRDRADDISLLAHWFVRKYEEALGIRIEKIDAKVFERFKEYAWPGNIRELQNAIERMMSFCPAGELTCDLIPAHIADALTMPEPAEAMESPAENEKKLMRKMLDLKFSRTTIARRMKISRATLYRKIRKYGLELAKPRL